VEFDVLMSRGIEEHVRPRFWYVVLANCAGSGYGGIVDVTYKLHTFQAEMTSWNEEFGVNETGINTTYLIFFFIYLVMVLTHSVGVQRLSRENGGAVHNIVKLFTASLWTQFFCIFFYIIHYGVYGDNGVGVPGANQFATFLEAIARISLILVLILLAQGWTISAEAIQHRMAIAAAIFLLFIFYLALIIWNFAARDPITTLYMYDSAAGALIVTVLFVVWIWFVVTIANTYRKEDHPAKKNLYGWLLVLYSLWLLSLPLFVLIGVGLEPWVREKTVTSINILATTGAYGVLAYLLWPTRAEIYFKIKTPDVMTNSNYDAL